MRFIFAAVFIVLVLRYLAVDAAKHRPAEADEDSALSDLDVK